MKGYKVFNPDWTCREQQYTCPGTFEVSGELELCENGIHFCKNAADCFNYYKFDSNNHVAEVEALGTVVEGDDKCCTDKLEILREIPWDEVLRLVNVGNWNTGDGNTGDWNTGCFNTITPTIMLFNQASEWNAVDWIHSTARYVLLHMPDTHVLVDCTSMSELERSEHPEAKIFGGYLQKVELSELMQMRQSWWDKLSKDDKESILSLPNFDAVIFKHITLIDVTENATDDKPA